MSAACPQVARILNDMAADDAAHGWRHCGPAVMQKQRRPQKNAHSCGSACKSKSRGVGSSGKRQALVAVPTANVWAKTQLLLHSLAATSDSFQLMVNRATDPLWCG